MNPTPCPRCGKLPDIEKNVTSFVVFHECRETPLFLIQLEEFFEDHPAAVTAWNEVVSVVKKAE